MEVLKYFGMIIIGSIIVFGFITLIAWAIKSIYVKRKTTIYSYPKKEVDDLMNIDDLAN